MEYVMELLDKTEADLETFMAARQGTVLTLAGAVHRIRDMGEMAFVILRTREGLFQTVWEGDLLLSLREAAVPRVREGCCLTVRGSVRTELRAPLGRELRAEEFSMLTEVKDPLPLSIGKWKMNTSLEARLDRRPLSLIAIQ